MTEEFKEKLPEGCPWEDCYNPSNLIVYRAVRDVKAVADDFNCYYNENPDKQNKYEKKLKLHCQTLGVSTHSTLEASKNLFRLPKFKKKYKGIAKLELKENSGKVSPENKDKHLTCWFYSQIDPLELIIEENEANSE